MNKAAVVHQLLAGRSRQAQSGQAHAFAPTNIALCKYWGKRNAELNLPFTSSLSISLGNKGATTELAEIEGVDEVWLNQERQDIHSDFAQRLVKFVDLFRPHPKIGYRIHTQLNIPVAAGLASSACGFAALVMALDALYGWDLDKWALSILARLGSGSAARSIWQGVVEWHAGEAEDGMDSYGQHLPWQWPQLRVGLVIVNPQQKPLSSRLAMERTVQTSHLYTAWPTQVAVDLPRMKHALATQDFPLLGQLAEHNAAAMHATMFAAWPSITYILPETLSAMQTVWQLRREGIPVFYTQDAGPNLKLLFLDTHATEITAAFQQIEVVRPLP